MDDLFRKILKLFDALGLWENGVELVGSWSFLLYQRHLGVRPLPLRTQDVDFLLPWPYSNKRNVDMKSALEPLGFRIAIAANGTTSFTHPELKLEFLVPEHGKGGMDYREIKPLGVKAIPLRFMDMLLKNSIMLKEGGVKVRVPLPLNYCLHKLMIAQRRIKADKKEKDIMQAVYVLSILKPAEFSAALADFSPKWRRLVETSLKFAWENFPLERPLLKRFMEEPD
ncbi:MAG: hypothetical protein COB53_05320 [Elusimicrobia bacterium]|nr:MAG: hypothetical protein COB53_05320 [Elusimicrobiota bacterium]